MGFVVCVQVQTSGADAQLASLGFNHVLSMTDLKVHPQPTCLFADPVCFQILFVVRESIHEYNVYVYIDYKHLFM